LRIRTIQSRINKTERAFLKSMTQTLKLAYEAKAETEKAIAECQFQLSHSRFKKKTDLSQIKEAL